MKFLFFILIASLLLVLNSWAFDAETEQAIDDIVENIFMKNNSIPGLSVSIVQNGTVLMSKGYGMKNIAANLPADGNTLYSIGSITKSFVAILVVKTLHELYPQLNESVLNVPLADLIPSTVNFTLSDRYRAEQTTFRDILSHRTCLLNGGIELVLGSLPSASEYAYRSRYLPQVCEFRNGYEYNNQMVALAGETIAAIAGTTLQNMVISFARDLGMTKTTYIDFDGSYELLPDMSQPYVRKDGKLKEFDIFQLRKVHMAFGAGGILSTSNDMAKYMNFHLYPGRVGDRQIVPTNVMNWLYTVSYPFDFRGGRTEEADSIVYGQLGTAIGLFSALYDGWNVIHHGGYWSPYQSDFRLYPATKIGIFITSSGPGAIVNYPTPDVVSYSIFELVRGEPDLLIQTTQQDASNETTEQDLSTDSKRRVHRCYSKVQDCNPFIEHQLFTTNKTNRASTALHYTQIVDRLEPEDIIGVYGHNHNGNLIIRYEPETCNTTLQIFFSQWAYGRLHKIRGSNTAFCIEWQTSIMDHFYSYPEVYNFCVDFEIADTALFRGGSPGFYEEYEFIKNAILDTFPAIPWTPTSCGPEKMVD